MIKIEVLKLAFEKINANVSFDTFIKYCDDIQEEQNKEVEVFNIYETIPSEFETVEDYIEEIVDKDDIHEIFYDEDGMDDNGADESVYYMIENKLYCVELHCEAEWVGDWSVRKNLPGDVSITSVKEITDFNIIENSDDYMLIKIK